MSLLTVDHISRTFGNTTALDQIGFSIAAGEIVGLIGRSGAGKSTLLRILCGLEKPDCGSVYLEGRNVTLASEAELVGLRRRIGFVFQHYNLLSRRTVAQNVALPLRIAGWDAGRIQHRVGELLDIVGLGAHRDHRPSQLSGGQKQRAGIARALAASPALLLCDEATSALDPQTTATILELLRDINRQLNVTIILITHEMDLIRRLAKRVLVLDAGKLAYDGSVLDLVSSDTPEPALARLCADLQPTLPLPSTRSSHASAEHPPVWRLISIGEATATPLLSRLAIEHGVLATILGGGTTDYAGTPVTDIIVALNGPLSASARQLIATTAPHSRDLGHVARYS